MSIDAEAQAAQQVADAIVETLTTDRGVHAETAVVAAARMAGTFLFRSFGLPTSGIPPGAPVFSDRANERGPLLVEVLEAGLTGLGIEVDRAVTTLEQNEEHQPQLTLLETQQALEPRLTRIATARGLDGETAARACALAAALLIHRTRSVLEPGISFGLAVYGFVEGAKTMPASPGPPLPKAAARLAYACIFSRTTEEASDNLVRLIAGSEGGFDEGATSWRATVADHLRSPEAMADLAHIGANFTLAQWQRILEQLHARLT